METMNDEWDRVFVALGYVQKGIRYRDTGQVILNCKETV